jgi:hypothetical protein
LLGESTQTFAVFVKAVADAADVRVSASHPIWADFKAFEAKQPNVPPSGDFGLPAYSR